MSTHTITAFVLNITGYYIKTLPSGGLHAYYQLQHKQLTSYSKKTNYALFRVLRIFLWWLCDWFSFDGMNRIYRMLLNMILLDHGRTTAI